MAGESEREIGTGQASDGCTPISDLTEQLPTRDTYYVRTRNTKESTQRQRFEVCSRGIDEDLQGIGSDPYGGISWTGLRVPGAANTPQTRYLFQLCSFEVPYGKRARIIGLRNGWSLGFRENPTTAPRLVEQWVNNPIFRLTNGNVSFHLRQMFPRYPRQPQPSPNPALNGIPNFAWETTDGSALLFQDAGFAAPSLFYPTLNRYVPPNAGMPWGNPLGGNLGTFNDPKVQWADGSDWHALDIPLGGPKRVALYASVLQSNLQGRTALSIGTVATFPLGLSPEEQFLKNYSEAVIWRVAGALMYEMEDYKP